MKRLVKRNKAIKGIELYVPPHATINGKYRREHEKNIAKSGTSDLTDKAEYLMQGVVFNFLQNVNFIRNYYGYTWNDFTLMLKRNHCALNIKYYFNRVSAGGKNSFPLFQICLICVILKAPVQVMMYEDIRDHFHLVGFGGLG